MLKINVYFIRFFLPSLARRWEIFVPLAFQIVIVCFLGRLTKIRGHEKGKTSQIRKEMEGKLMLPWGRYCVYANHSKSLCVYFNNIMDYKVNMSGIIRVKHCELLYF